MTTAETVIDDRVSMREVLKSLGPRLLALLQFLAGRLLYAITTLLLIIFLTFLGLEMARGADFSTAVVYGLTSTVDYIGRLLRGDLGAAYAAGFGERRTEIVEIVRETLPRSLGLVLISVGGATIIGVTLGTLAASRRGPFKSLSLPTILLSLIGVSLPTFFMALLLQILVVKITRLTGRTLMPVGGFGWDAHLILPALVLATRPIAHLTRITNVTLTNVLREDFVRTAASKGLSNCLLWFRHVGPNAAIPILTTIGLAIRFSLSSLPVVELYFGWAGIGQVLLRAIARQDDLLTVTLALCLGSIFIVTNFILEACYRLIDPRLRDKTPQRAVKMHARADSLAEGVRALVESLRVWPVLRLWLSPKTEADRAYEERVRPKRAQAGKGELSQNIRRQRAKTWLRATLGSLPFVVGLLMLMALLAVYIAGPALSPANPYNTRGIAKVEGVIAVPPFPPSATYPWGSDALGRDMMSLVLSGAIQTLTLVALVMLARLAVGFVLGALAGWQQDTWLDRAIMALNEAFAALPTLIFAMILILALGIRRGIWVFVFALCFIGWGEMTQFIRSEVIVIRKQLFIESATALGSRLAGIIVRHILPNLLPALISLAALEMGSVAMLLGELGFIGIFIGGGAFAEVDIGGPPYHYSDAPEWGALLSNVRAYARSFPWTAFPPAAAFFFAVLAFNLFGEGLRRLVQDVGLSFNRLANRYTLAAVIVLIFALRWVESNSGSMVFLRQQANRFDQAGAMSHFNYLTEPALEGRAVGAAGADQAADYIAARFAEYGLQPGGKKGTYFFDVKRDFVTLTETPRLSANGQPLVYRQDFAEIPLDLLNASGPKAGKLVVLLAGEQVFGNRAFTGRNFSQAVADLDLADKAVLLLDQGGLMPDVLRQGTFYLTHELEDLTKRDSLAAYSTQAPAFVPLGGSPFYYISEDGANKLLAPAAGMSIDHLVAQEQKLEPDEVVLVETRVTVESSMRGEVQEKVPARHVIGYWPGHDENLDENLTVVLAQYDGLGVDASGQPYPSANETVSGVAVMLELLRSWQESNYQPKKTFIFVVYVGEGFDHNQRPTRAPDVERFISGKFGFAANFIPEAFVFLAGVGAGAGDDLTLAAGGNIRLAQLFERAARQMRVPTRRANERFNLDVIYGGTSRALAEDAPTITLTWSGADEIANTPADTPAGVDPKKLLKAGKLLSLALAIIGREVNY